MGLEDFAMFRTILGSTVLCPSDASSTAKLVAEIVDRKGIVFLRTARPETEVLYGPGEEFKVGGSKTLRSSSEDVVTVVACGVTVFEAIKAADELLKSKINIRVVDAYSIKPIDEETLVKCAHETNNLVVVVEDHNIQGGLGDAVLEVFATDPEVKVFKMGVFRMPTSAKPEEQFKFEGIDSASLVSKVREIIK
jgi:transketolase